MITIEVLQAIKEGKEVQLITREGNWLDIGKDEIIIEDLLHYTWRIKKRKRWQWVITSDNSNYILTYYKAETKEDAVNRMTFNDGIKYKIIEPYLPSEEEF